MAVTYEDDVSITIDGVNINKFATALQGITTVEALEALNIGAQFEGDEEEFLEEVLAQMSFFAGTYVGGEISIVHTNGVTSTAAGAGSKAPASTIGAGVDGNGDLVLDPISTYWATMSVPARATMLRVKTNIRTDDGADQSNAAVNGFTFSLFRGYKTAANAATSGVMKTLTAGSTGPISAGGTNTPVASGPAYAGNIGDLATWVLEIPIADPGNTTTQIGDGAAGGGNYWMTLFIQVGSAADSKTYKVQLEVDYET